MTAICMLSSSAHMTIFPLYCKLLKAVTFFLLLFISLVPSAWDVAGSYENVSLK